VKFAVEGLLRPAVVLDILAHFTLFATDKKKRRIKVVCRFDDEPVGLQFATGAVGPALLGCVRRRGEGAGVRREGSPRMAGRELAGLTVALYARFSSENQRETSIEDQIRRRREYVEERGGTVRKDLIFADRAVSGASMDRPQFGILTALATSAPPKVDVIVVEGLSRVGRDQADLHLFRRAIEYSRVRLIALADGIDTAAAHSELAFTMKTAVPPLRSSGSQPRGSARSSGSSNSVLACACSTARREASRSPKPALAFWSA
jgi:predicted site-specific integrase-resolvase